MFLRFRSSAQRWQNFGNSGSREEMALRQHAAVSAEETFRAAEARKKDMLAWAAYMETYHMTGVRFWVDSALWLARVSKSGGAASLVSPRFRRPYRPSPRGRRRSTT